MGLAVPVEDPLTLVIYILIESVSQAKLFDFMAMQSFWFGFVVEKEGFWNLTFAKKKICYIIGLTMCTKLCCNCSNVVSVF